MLCKTGGLGGMERLVARLAGQLPAWGLKTELVLSPTRRKPVDPEVLTWFRRRGVIAKVVSPSRIAPLLDPVHLLRLARLFRKTEAEVLDLHFGGSDIFLQEVLAARLAGKRCVVSPHNAMPLRTFWHAGRARIATVFCADVVVGNHALRGLLLEAGVPQRKIRLIKIGVPAPHRSVTREEARHQFGIAPDEFVILSVTRLIRAKGVDLVIAAVTRLAESYSRLTLMIVGDGEERQALQVAAGRSLKDRVRFLGFIEDPESAYSAADVLVLATRADGAPMVPKEAARFGVPSIATDIGGVRDSITDGETGLIVPSEDVRALSFAIQRLIDDDQLRFKLGEGARRRCELEFSEAEMLQGYAEVLAPSGEKRAQLSTSA